MTQSKSEAGTQEYGHDAAGVKKPQTTVSRDPFQRNTEARTSNLR